MDVKDGEIVKSDVGIVESRHVINETLDYHRYMWKIESIHRDDSNNKLLLKSPLFTIPYRVKLNWYMTLQSIDFGFDSYRFICHPKRLCLDDSSDCDEAFAKYNLYIWELDNEPNPNIEWNSNFRFVRKTIENYVNHTTIYGRNENPSTFTVVCELMIENVHLEDSCSKDYGSLLKNQKFSDVVLSVGEKNYPAHKAMLSARSSVFAAILAENQDVIRIEDMDEEVVEEMLSYIYTGEVQKLNDLAKHLFIAALKYNLKGLQMKCQVVLIKSLSYSNAFDLLLFAELQNANHLKCETINYIRFHSTEVVKTSGWENICQSHPELQNIFKSDPCLMVEPELKENETV